MEISIKAGLGRLKADPREVLGALEPAFLQLPISGEHSTGVAMLPPLHLDPCDRLLVA